MKLFIKNMVSPRCMVVVHGELKKLGLTASDVSLGEAVLPEPMTGGQLLEFKNALLASGLELIEDKRNMLLEKIRNVVIQLVHHRTDQLRTNFSVFLSETLGYNYTYMANIFSAVKGMTIERFLISHKIERVKELLGYGELNLTEIADKLHYSSVAHLSNQFKMITGVTPSRFRHSGEKGRINLENI